jgi:uncharacterized protein with HEPN domain
LILRLTDIVEAIARIREVIGDMTLDAFEADGRNSGSSNAA